MRLHRERRRQGLRCLMIELRETEIDVLIGKGLLNSEMRHDPPFRLSAACGTEAPSSERNRAIANCKLSGNDSRLDTPLRDR
jgi:hypothetical protein